MHPALLRRLIIADFEDLLENLATRQHLHPHEAVSQTLAAAVEKLGVCPQAVEQAVAWLHMDPATPVGRLRRTELMQLARSLHRFWQESAAASAPAVNPT
jgi:hypothetical protein